jgi:hypothetical protein
VFAHHARSIPVFYINDEEEEAAVHDNHEFSKDNVRREEVAAARIINQICL